MCISNAEVRSAESPLSCTGTLLTGPFVAFAIFNISVIYSSAVNLNVTGNMKNKINIAKNIKSIIHENLISLCV